MLAFFFLLFCPASAWRLPAARLTGHNGRTWRRAAEPYPLRIGANAKQTLNKADDVHAKAKLVQLLQSELARAFQKSETKLRQANVAEVSMETYLKSPSLASKAERLENWAELVMDNLDKIPMDAEEATVLDKEGKLVTLEFDTNKFGSPREQAEDALTKAQRVHRTKSRVDGLRLRTEASLKELLDWQRQVAASEHDLQALHSLRLEMLESAKELGVRPTVLQSD